MCPVCLCVRLGQKGCGPQDLLSSLKHSLPLSFRRRRLSPQWHLHTEELNNSWQDLGPASQIGRGEHSIIITQCHNRIQNSFHINFYTIGILKLDFYTEEGGKMQHFVVFLQPKWSYSSWGARCGSEWPEYAFRKGWALPEGDCGSLSHQPSQSFL